MDSLAVVVTAVLQVLDSASSSIWEKSSGLTFPGGSAERMAVTAAVLAVA